MRLFLFGPSLFGGLIRPGISFGFSGARRPARATASQDFVYVVDGGQGLVKIGVSTDPTARLVTLQTGSPHRLRLAFTAPTFGHAFEIEQEAHAILAAQRANGEWFAVSSDLAIAALFGAADRTGFSMSEPNKDERLIRWPRSSIGQILIVLMILYGIGSLILAFRPTTKAVDLTEPPAVSQDR